MYPLMLFFQLPFGSWFQGWVMLICRITARNVPWPLRSAVSSVGSSRSIHPIMELRRFGSSPMKLSQFCEGDSTCWCWRGLGWENYCIDGSEERGSPVYKSPQVVGNNGKRTVSRVNRFWKLFPDSSSAVINCFGRGAPIQFLARGSN